MKKFQNVKEHCAVIASCNQRGGRMLSVVDLVEADTMSVDIAAYSLAAISAGASFMVGALPGGAGKTTVMGALLNLVSPDTQLVAAEDELAVEKGLNDHCGRRCYVCHEIGPGHYYAYLWGATLSYYFKLPAVGHMIATNLHADTYEQARAQICDENRVPCAAFHRVNLLYFLTQEGVGANCRRRIAAIWESDDAGRHRQVFGPGVAGPLRGESGLVSSENFDSANETVKKIIASGACTIEKVRSALICG